MVNFKFLLFIKSTLYIVGAQQVLFNQSTKVRVAKSLHIYAFPVERRVAGTFSKITHLILSNSIKY